MLSLPASRGKQKGPGSNSPAAPSIPPNCFAKTGIRLATGASKACGVMALRKGRSKRTRGLFFAGALVVYFYIVSVALLHNPLGFLSLIDSAFS